MTVLDSLSSNPFSSRFLRPGEIPYQWFDSKPINGESSNKTWSEVSQKFLEACKGRACIWGPHGSGKSTFLHAFLPRVSKLEACFGWTEPLQFDLEESQKRLQGMELSARLFRMTKDGSTSDILQKDVAHWNQHTLIVIDGYEQLSWLRRWWLRYHVLSKSIRLLVTSPSAISLLSNTCENHSDRRIGRMGDTAFDASGARSGRKDSLQSKLSRRSIQMGRQRKRNIVRDL